MIKANGERTNPNTYLCCSVKNSLEQRFCAPIHFSGPQALALARRIYDSAVKQIPEGAPTRPSDLSLWVVGEFDPETGRYESYDKPVDVSLIGG